MDPGSIRSSLNRVARPGSPRLLPLTEPFSGVTRIALVPGSFDPMTVAHAALVDALLRDAADAVVLTYSPHTMPKEGAAQAEPPLLPPERRVASILAFAGSQDRVGVALSSHGLYVDQAEAAWSTFAGSDLVFGVGSDKLVQLTDPAWYADREAALDRLFARAGVRYAVRWGHRDRVTEALGELRRWADRIRPVAVPEDVAPISSTSVRRAVRAGDDVSGLVPPEVLPYVSP